MHRSQTALPCDAVLMRTKERPRFSKMRHLPTAAPAGPVVLTDLLAPSDQCGNGQFEFHMSGLVDLCFQRFRDFDGYLFLHHQFIVRRPIIGFRPHDVTVVRANEPHHDAQPVV